jgi:hypothetical protein
VPAVRLRGGVEEEEEVAGSRIRHRHRRCSRPTAALGARAIVVAWRRSMEGAALCRGLCGAWCQSVGEGATLCWGVGEEVAQGWRCAARGATVSGVGEGTALCGAGLREESCGGIGV